MGQHRLNFNAPRLWRRHDGARGLAYNRAWIALTKEYGVPATGSLLAMDMSRVAQAWVEKAEAGRALEDARRNAEAGGRGRSRAEVRRLEARHLRADRAYQDSRELLERTGAAARHAHRYGTPRA